MKKILFLFFLLTINLISAQNNHQFWTNIRHSAYNSENEMHIRCETIDLEAVQTEFWYRNNNQIWTSQNMQLIENLTYGTVFPYSENNTNFCRFRTETDTVVLMMPAFLPDNSIPGNIETLGFVADDPEGDCLSENSDMLDITSNYFGFSDDKFFVGMENVSGDFPTYSGFPFPDEFYFYIGGLINMEAVIQDTVIYGLIYADFPLINKGLYKIRGGNFNFDNIQRIGDIEFEILNNSLLLSCNISDLINDEDFGDWPNFSNSLGFQILTNKAGLDMELGLADVSKPSIQTFSQYIIEPFENILPCISNFNVQTLVANTLVSLDYFDANGNFPLKAQLETHHENPDLDTIYQLHPTSNNFTEIVQFVLEFNNTNWNEIVITFSDNNNDFIEETVYETDLNENDLPLNHISLSNYPNPFNPSTTISFSTTEHLENTKLIIYNVKGQRIREFIIKNTNSKINEVAWDGKGDSGKAVSTGVYLYKLKTDGKMQAANKMLLLK